MPRPPEPEDLRARGRWPPPPGRRVAIVGSRRPSPYGEAVAERLAADLAATGVIVVSGQFGLTTQNVQFHNTDRFSSWEELRAARSETALVNKRIRSLRRWKRCAAEAGLHVDAVRRNRAPEGITTPENNVLMLTHRA